MTATTIQTQPRTSNAVAAVVAALTVVASVASARTSIVCASRRRPSANTLPGVGAAIFRVGIVGGRASQPGTRARASHGRP